MKLVIHKPCYYEKHFAINDEINNLCKSIIKTAEHKIYSKAVNYFSVAPVIAPPELLEEGMWAEEVMFTKLACRASVFKHIHFDEYVNGDIKRKKELIIECIVEAGKMLAGKKATQFDSEQFAKDILELTSYLDAGMSDEEIIQKMNRFTMETNGEEYKNRVASPYSINEALDYLQKEGKAGNIEEFLILNNNETENFIQTYWTEKGYHVEVSIEAENGERKLSEKDGISKKEVKEAFISFLEGEEL